MFSHTLYRSREDGTYHYLLDEQMHLPKDERFTEQAEVKLLQEAARTSYQQAANKLCAGAQGISKTAVMNKLHQLAEELPLTEMKEKRQVQYLYIEADEDHIHLQKAEKRQKGSCIAGKLVYVHEGRQKVCGGKTELVHPVYFGGMYKGQAGNRALWERVGEYIEKNYDQEILKRVYLSGDGASWIKAGTEYVEQSVFVADKFHVMQYISRAARQVPGSEEKIRREIYESIRENRLKKAYKLLKEAQEHALNGTAVEECREFLRRNWGGIERAYHDENAQGCSAEGHVSHVYSERMSSRPMGWSETGADRMCQLRCQIQTGGKEKVKEVVRARREASYGRRLSKRKQEIKTERSQVRRRYTKGEMEAALYAEKLNAELSGTRTRKQLWIWMKRNLY